MNRTVKVALMTFGFLVLWMFSGIFSKDESGSIEKIEITSEQTNATLVRARQFEAVAKLPFVVLRGRTEAEREVLISAETTGIIEEIYPDKGDFVFKGEIICRQSVDAREAKLDEANALMKQRDLEWQASKHLLKA